MWDWLKAQVKYSGQNCFVQNAFWFHYMLKNNFSFFHLRHWGVIVFRIPKIWYKGNIYWGVPVLNNITVNVSSQMLEGSLEPPMQTENNYDHTTDWPEYALFMNSLRQFSQNHTSLKENQNRIVRPLWT